MSPRVALVLPALNAAPYVRDMARALRAQRLRPERVIVVDSSSTDGSRADWLAAGCEVVRIDRRDFDHGGTRNLGARLAGDADILVFMTQDAIPADESWLEELCAPLLSGEAVAAYARQLPRPEASPLETFARTFNYPPEPALKTRDDVARLGIKAYFFSNVCSAVKRDAFWAVGGFPERIILNEDMVLAARLMAEGGTVAYAASARVYHSHDYTLKQQFKRNFDIGASWAEVPELQGLAVVGEGLRFVRGQLGYVVARGRPELAPYAVLEAATKFAALRLGERHRLLPPALRRTLSMHAYHWDAEARPAVSNDNEEVKS